MQPLEKIKSLLLRKQKKVEQEIKALEKDDPLLNGETAHETSEPGTDSWLADTHSRIVAVKKSLQEILINIKKSLLSLKSGKYGKCENCGKAIEPQRLEAIPTTTLCISCSRKKSKK